MEHDGYHVIPTQQAAGGGGQGDLPTLPALQGCHTSSVSGITPERLCEHHAHSSRRYMQATYGAATQHEV